MTGLLPHLVESTLWAAAVWLLTLALRRNQARARHALWLTASVKFLIPFSLLVGLGSYVVRQPAPSMPEPQMRFVLVDAASARPPSIPVAKVTPAAARRRDWQPVFLWLLWMPGTAAVLIRWYVRWRAAAVPLRESTPCRIAPQERAPVHFSNSILEPGIFGIFRPVLLLPAGIEAQLSAEQLRAVLTHEMCHVRYRDNLAAAIHMAVEAIFWFHPLVWWIGARLVEERERACDEEVLQLGNDRAVYAEGILRVCRFCLESPVPCISGIAGADLKQRIRNIMSGTVMPRLEPYKKLLLASLALAAVVVPMTIGLMHPQRMAAYAAQSAARLSFEVASVKVNNGNILSTRPKRSGGRLAWTTDLWYLLGYAFKMQPWRISGEISGSDHLYEVEAATDPHTSDDDMRLMLQSLLMERFKMVVHREIKPAVEGYALTVAKDGPKMQAAGDLQGSESAADADEWISATLPERNIALITGHRGSMLQLTETMQRLLSTIVIDQTELTGKYNFTMQYPRNDDPSDNSGVLSGVKQLGLRLEKYKGPVEYLVVDHIEKTPTQN